MSKPCLDCTKRYLGCHDKCDDYQATKPKYKADGYNDTESYIHDKRLRLKKDYGGRD